LNDSMTRGMITSYTALGGSLVYSVIDSLSGFWRQNDDLAAFEEE